MRRTPSNHEHLVNEQLRGGKLSVSLPAKSVVVLSLR